MATQALSAALDLTKAVVFVPAGLSGVERKAVSVLVEEVQQRAQVTWEVTTTHPSEHLARVMILPVSSWADWPKDLGLAIDRGFSAPEGFQVQTGSSEAAPLVCVAGNDARGVLFGVGYLLRQLHTTRGRVILPAAIQVKTAPKARLRGCQLGYRPKTNSYDGWSVAMWEQYLRDLAVFGCNAIELIPPRSDDDDDSPHFPLPPMPMMVEMSRLAQAYGMDVWIWYPALDKDYADLGTVATALAEWGAVFQQLPRLDAVLVPGGDPGQTPPNILLPFLEKQAENLRRFHPQATLWVSPQGFSQAWLADFLELLKAEPPWLAGVAHGPQVRLSIADLRAQLPARYPIRDYPDITHSRHCQYPVPDWDLAYALTEGRESINPRPRAMASIYRRTHADTIGSIVYSEGCQDDVNKIVWLGLGWDDQASVEELLRQYSRYFVGSARAESFARGLLGLERNWEGPLRLNTGVEETFRLFQSLEQSATPSEKLNWRVQMALYRAYYDAYLRRRLLDETRLEAQAMDQLRAAPRLGALAAMEAAERLLERAERQPAAGDLRARVFELAEALFQSIRLQLSVKKYQAIALERGANLDAIDEPLNNRLWLRRQFADIRQIQSESERCARLASLVHWQDAGPGGYYDDLGNPEQQPHLVRGPGFPEDPSFLESALVSFFREPRSEWPMSWRQWAEPLYDQPLQVRYTGLDPAARYRVRVVYGRERRDVKVRLVANERTEVHPYLCQPFRVLEFDLPAEATASGELRLRWNQEAGSSGAGRGCQVAEVWLVRRGR